MLKKIHSWYQQFSKFYTCLLKTQHLTADCNDEKRNMVCKSFAQLLFLATGDDITSFQKSRTNDIKATKIHLFFTAFI